LSRSASSAPSGTGRGRAMFSSRQRALTRRSPGLGRSSVCSGRNRLDIGATAAPSHSGDERFPKAGARYAERAELGGNVARRDSGPAAGVREGQPFRDSPPAQLAIGIEGGQYVRDRNGVFGRSEWAQRLRRLQPHVGDPAQVVQGNLSDDGARLGLGGAARICVPLKSDRDHQREPSLGVVIPEALPDVARHADVEQVLLGVEHPVHGTFAGQLAYGVSGTGRAHCWWSSCRSFVSPRSISTTAAVDRVQWFAAANWSSLAARSGVRLTDIFSVRSASMCITLPHSAAMGFTSRGQHCVALARHGLSAPWPAGLCWSVARRNSAQHWRNAVFGSLTCENTSRATREPRSAGRAAEALALGRAPRRGGQFAGTADAVVVRRMREAPRPSPRLHAEAQGPRPDRAAPVVHLPVVREVRAEPAGAYLQRPVGLREAEGRAGSCGQGRRPAAETPRDRGPETRPAEGA